MVELAQVREFMRGHVVDEMRRQHHQTPVEEYSPVGAAAAPTGPRVGKTYGQDAKPAQAHQLRNPFAEKLQRLRPHPVERSLAQSRPGLPHERSPARLGEPSADPALPFPDERLDIGDRGMAWGARLDSVPIDEQRDGPPLCAHKVVAQYAACELKLAKTPGDLRSRDDKWKLQLPQRRGHRLAMRLSIHSSTDRFSDSGV